MAGYSKDQERQNKALKDLMSGKEYEKEYVQVGYEGKKEDLGGKTRESDLSKVMQSVRMPLFCPSCKKTMKKKLDDKFWRTKGHCFDCQIEFENNLRVKGEFDNYAKGIINGNKKAYLKDLKQSLEEFEETGFERTVVVEFKSHKDAIECYNSRDYQSALEYVKDSATRYVSIVEGV